MPSLQVLFADGRRITKTLERTSPLTVGAQSFNDVCIAEPGVPPLVCRIGWNKTGFEITAATPNGIEVNGTVVAHAQLRNDDLIRIGSADAIFLDDAPTVVTPPAKKSVEERKLTPEPEPSLFEGPVHVESSSEEFASANDSDELPALPRKQYEERAAESPPPPVAMAPRDVTGAVHRPGEEQVFKSPLILTLTTVTVVLILVAASLYFLMGRESQSQLFATGEKELASGRYTQSIEAFEQFRRLYPRSQQRHAADIGIGKALVQRELSAAPPRWENAWKQLQELVSAQRKSSDYGDLQPIVRDLAEQIALGSARTAETAAEEKLLTLSAEATQLMERSTPPNSPESPALKQIREASDRARGAIVRRRALDAAIDKMTKALEAGDAIAALATRQALLLQFPQFTSEKRFQPLVKQAQEVALKAVVSHDVDRDAETRPASATSPSVLPVVHARSRTDDSSLGQVVYVVAADSCYAVDTITGDVVWRRAIGRNPPFFPVALREPKPSVLLYDRPRQQLLLCDAKQGDVIWRQTFQHEPVGGPVLYGSQLYLATRGRTLLRLDALSGRISTQIDFPQDLAAAPALSPDGETLLISGQRGLVYSLSTHPLACQAVTFTDHAEGSVRVPLLAMGRLFLFAEHDQADSSRLRVYRQTDLSKPLVEEGSARIRGGVYDPPVLRGAQLVVPTQGERLAAFAVDDEPNRTALSPIGEYRVQDAYGGPLQVALGPDQQFWMSSTAFRRFELGTDSIKMDSRVAAVGITAQPLQAVAETFFVGRRQPASTAVTLSNIDREKLTGSWRTVVGGRPLATTVAENGNLIIASDAGAVFRLSAGRLQQPGIESRAFEELELPPNLDQPLIAARQHDGRIAIIANGAAPQWWIVEKTGALGKPQKLPENLLLPPVLLDVGWVLPRPTRLSVIPTSATKLDDWRAPADGDQTAKWTALLRLSGTELLLGESNGRWRRLQVRMGDIPHLAEAQAVDLPPLKVPPRVAGDTMIALDEEGRLHRLDAQTLDDTAQRTVGDQVTGFELAGASHVLVWSPGALHGIPLAELQAEGWTLPLGGLHIVGTPLFEGDLASFATSSGVIVTVDWKAGREVRRETLPQSLSGHVLTLGQSHYAIAADGAVYRLQDGKEATP